MTIAMAPAPAATAGDRFTDPVDDAMPCPLCGADGRVLFRKHGHGVCRCETCQHRYADVLSGDIVGSNEAVDVDEHIASTYGDDYFNGGGAGYVDYLSEGTLIRRHGRRYGKLLAKHGTPGRVLDVGAAAGFVLEGLVDEGWSGIGVEPNDSVAAVARARGLDVRTGSFERFRTDETFDLVSMVQVMAHFADPHAALEQVAALTRPGGMCLVETWNVGSWTARFFGRSWHEYSPPSVLHWFTPQRLASLFAEHGFEPVTKGRPRKLLEVAHAQSLMKHVAGDGWFGRLARSPLALLPGRMAIPYPAEDLFWGLYRRT